MTDAVVELSIPASSQYVVLARSAAAAIASRLDFTLDRLEDLKLAVDEAVSVLLPMARGDDGISCAFSIDESRLTVTISVRSPDALPPDRSGFAWTVLAALVDDVQATAEADRVAIVLSATGGSPS